MPGEKNNSKSGGSPPPGRKSTRRRKQTIPLCPGPSALEGTGVITRVNGQSLSNHVVALP
jgi:hypothetical protein